MIVLLAASSTSVNFNSEGGGLHGFPIIPTHPYQFSKMADPGGQSSFRIQSLYQNISGDNQTVMGT